MGSARRKPIVVVGLVLMAALAVTLYMLQQAPQAKRQSDELFGNVEIREVHLGFRAGGRIEALLVDEGDAVHPGQTLARLERTPAEDTLAIVEAEWRRALAQLELVRAGARPQEIAQARAAVRDAQAAFDNAERDAQRQLRLLQSESTSRTQVDAAQALRDRSEAQLASSREALALVEAGARVEDIRAAEASVSVAQARLDQARTALGDTVLRAPVTGVIRTRAREVGAMVSTGQTVYSLAMNDRVFVRAYVEEPRLHRTVPGKPVTITTDSGNRYRGQIGFVSPTAEFTPRTVQTPALRTDLVYRLRIIVVDANEQLRQGMPVTVMLTEENDASSSTRSDQNAMTSIANF